MGLSQNDKILQNSLLSYLMIITNFSTTVRIFNTINIHPPPPPRPRPHTNSHHFPYQANALIETIKINYDLPEQV